MDIKINLGCGPHPIKGFINVDNNPDVNPDVCMDVFDYIAEFELNSVDEIYCAHNLEHYQVEDAEILISTCQQILKPGGKAYFVVPNVQVGWEMYKKGQIDKRTMDGIIYGTINDRIEDSHKQYYDDKILYDQLKIWEWEVEMVTPDKIPNIVSHVKWQSCAIAKK